MRSLFLFLCCVNLQLSAQHPPRKALMGLRGIAVAEGIKIDSVFPGGTIAALKLMKDDVLTSLNQQPLSSLNGFNQLASLLRAGDKIALTYIRNKQPGSVQGTAVMRPFEKMAGVDILYDWMAFKQGFLRAITRKPAGQGLSLPCYLFPVTGVEALRIIPPAIMVN